MGQISSRSYGHKKGFFTIHSTSFPATTPCPWRPSHWLKATTSREPSASHPHPLAFLQHLNLVLDSRAVCTCHHETFSNYFSSLYLLPVYSFPNQTLSKDGAMWMLGQALGSAPTPDDPEKANRGTVPVPRVQCQDPKHQCSATWELVRKAKSQAIWEPSHSKVNSGGEAQRLFEQALQMGLGSLTFEGR